MTTMPCSPGQEIPAATVGSHSVWKQFVAVFTGSRTPRAQDAITAYLDRHQHDLPPVLRIELERCRVL
jgi:hypothetical protein